LNYFDNNTTKSFSIKEAEALVHSDRSTIYRHIVTNKLKADVYQKPLRIRKNDLQSYMLKFAPKNYMLWQDEESSA